MSEQLLRQILDELRDIKGDQQTVNQAVLEMSETVHRIETEQQSLKDEQQGMKGELHGLKGDMQGMKDDLQGIKGELRVIKDEQQVIKQAVLETNESVKRLEAIQEQQHHIIELLSARSIEQEAALKRIK